jgi:hypothetical protein
MQPSSSPFCNWLIFLIHSSSLDAGKIRQDVRVHVLFAGIIIGLLSAYHADQNWFFWKYLGKYHILKSLQNM